MKAAISTVLLCLAACAVSLGAGNLSEETWGQLEAKQNPQRNVGSACHYRTPDGGSDVM